VSSQAPEIDPPDGPAPTSLVIKDIALGAGDLAVAGARVKVHYVGVDFETGDEFDSSWGRGEPIEFPLSGLIAGWQEGIPGMAVGGRRRLEIPPALAYGETGGHRLAGRTLVFIIDLLGVR
jgi:peptidylprolyl isomerase